MWFRFCVSFQEVGVRRAAAAFFREFVFFTHIFYKISDLTRDTQILDWSHDYWWLKRKSLYHSDGFHAALLQKDDNELEVLRDWGLDLSSGFPMGEFRFKRYNYMAVKRPVEPKQSPFSSGSSDTIPSWLLSRICKLLDMAKRLFSISSSFTS